MAKNKKDTRKVWFVEFPTHRYTQDVKTIARKGDLKILDAKVQGKREQCTGAPKLTLKPEFQPKIEE